MTAQKSSFCATSAGPRWATARAAASEVLGVGLVKEAVHGERAGEGSQFEEGAAIVQWHSTIYAIVGFSAKLFAGKERSSGAGLRVAMAGLWWGLTWWCSQAGWCRVCWGSSGNWTLPAALGVEIVSACLAEVRAGGGGCVSSVGRGGLAVACNMIFAVRCSR